MVEEGPRYGGLIDFDWLMTRIIIPIFIVAFFIITVKMILSCPYVEDVSSCYPYNLPVWAMITIPVALVLFILTSLIIITKLGPP